MDRDSKGLSSIKRMADKCDDIVGNLNTKFKFFCVNAAGHFAGIVVHYSLEQ
jgi:hypothetical protein